MTSARGFEFSRRRMGLAAGVALVMGATTLGPAFGAEATPIATCPDSNLTETQLNHLIVDVNGATATRGAAGYRATEVQYDDIDDSVWYHEVKTSDVANGRLDRVSTYDGLGTDRFRSLANGFSYGLADTTEPELRPALAVLGRTSVWVNRGKDDTAAERTRPYKLSFVADELSEVSSGGTCEQNGSGLTIGFYEDRSFGLLTVETDSSLAVTSVTTTIDGHKSDLTTIEYGPFTVADIPADQRIASSTLLKADAAARQRAALLKYGTKLATGAKAMARQAHRPVRAADVKAVKATPPAGAKRSTMQTGVLVTATDKYTRKALRLTVTVVQTTVRIGDNW